MRRTIKIISQLFLFVVGFVLGVVSSYSLHLAKEHPGSPLIYVPLVTLIFGYLLNKLLTWILKKFGVEIKTEN